MAASARRRPISSAEKPICVEHLARVLTRVGRVARRQRWRDGHADGIVHDAVLAVPRVVQRQHHVVVGDLGVDERLGEVVDRGVGHVGGPEPAGPVLGGLLAHFILQQPDDLGPCRQPAGVGGEALFRGQVISAEGGAYPRPERVLEAGHDDRAVGGLERLVRDDGRMPAAGPPRHLAGGEVGADVLRHQRNGGVEQVHRDLLSDTVAVAGPQRGQDRERAQIGAGVVRHSGTALGRRPVRLARQRHHAAQRLSGDVHPRFAGARPVLAERGDRQVHDGRVYVP